MNNKLILTLSALLACGSITLSYAGKLTQNRITQQAPEHGSQQQKITPAPANNQANAQAQARQRQAQAEAERARLVEEEHQRAQIVAPEAEFVRLQEENEHQQQEIQRLQAELMQLKQNAAVSVPPPSPSGAGFNGGSLPDFQREVVQEVGINNQDYSQLSAVDTSISSPPPSPLPAYGDAPPPPPPPGVGLNGRVSTVPQGIVAPKETGIENQDALQSRSQSLVLPNMLSEGRTGLKPPKKAPMPLNNSEQSEDLQSVLMKRLSNMRKDIAPKDLPINGVDEAEWEEDAPSAQIE